MMAMKLALGTVQFGLDYGIANQHGQVTKDEASKILNYAKEQGVNTLDTAISYGNSEQRLGEIGVATWQIVTKLPAIPNNCQDLHGWVHQQVQNSLIRLGREHVYGLLLHRPDQLYSEKGSEIYQALCAVKQHGWVKKIGVSIYEPDELALLTQYFQWDLVQAPFNLFDRRMLLSGWMARLTQLNIELHTRSVFLQGLLLMTDAQRPEQFKAWQSVWNTWYHWLADNNVTALQACLSDALIQTGIAKVVVGVDCIVQFKEILTIVTKQVHLDLPKEGFTNDIKLINPVSWSTL